MKSTGEPPLALKMKATDTDNPAVLDSKRRTYAMLGEFTNVDSLLAACRAVRKAGYTRWDAHSPFPIHGIDSAMGTRQTILPWLVLGAGLGGALLGIALPWYTNAVEYPYYISGKPLMSTPAFVPVIFELAVLFSALTAVFGMILLNGMPMLYNPLLSSERFRRVTSDRFFVVIGADDRLYDAQATETLLRSLGAVHVETVED